MVTSTWVRVGTLADIPRLGSRTVVTADGTVAVFRAAEDRVFALDNRCPHKGGPLSEGLVSGQLVVCPLHNWTIDLQSGEATLPDQGCTRTLEVRSDAQGLWLKLPAKHLAAPNSRTTVTGSMSPPRNRD
ncbi:MAG: nitrite reductase small subunit NirD [Rhodospirillales bacterium]|nr:nitrite reductase small subunit NirD [Rhodospirillales bacterium]